MNNTISTTIGIDTVIQSIQTDLYNELTAQWEGSVDGYGRVYKNIDANGSLKPEWYLGNNEYKDVYYNDAFACSYMFIDDDNHTTEDEVVFNTPVKVVFMMDLERVKPEESGRADVIAQNDVIEVLRNFAFERFSITGITKGIRNVFRGFETKGIKFSDIHPYHCFSVDIQLSYYLTDKCD
jgi:hypothetical protein